MLALLSYIPTACDLANTDLAQASQPIRDQTIVLDRTRFILLKLGEDAVISIAENVRLYYDDWTEISSKDEVKPGETVIVEKADTSVTGYVAVIQSDISITEYTVVVEGTSDCPSWTKSLKRCEVQPIEFIVGDRNHNLLTP